MSNLGWNCFKNVFQYYNNPKRVEEWPTCVNSCWRRLPAVPDRTGLEPVIPENTIPSGQHGKYVCTDTSLGVERVIFSIFDINQTTHSIQFRMIRDRPSFSKLSASPMENTKFQLMFWTGQYAMNERQQ